MGSVLDSNEFGRLFSSFTISAFRLETLPAYKVASEEVDLARYLAGEPLPLDPNSEWAKLVAEHCAAGRTMTRVHVVPALLTPYLRYEIDWGYRFSAAAGEAIFLLREADAETGVRRASDFWLFDDETVVQMKYSPLGEFIGAEYAAGDAIATYRTLRDRALRSALPLRDFLALTRSSRH